MYRTVSMAVALSGLLLAAPVLAQQPDSAKPAAKHQMAPKAAPAANHQAAPTVTRTTAQTAGAKPAVRHRYTKADVKAAQEGLAKAGFYKGKATGVWNSETTRALRAWQKANKEKVNGRLTEDELAKLKPQPKG